VPSLQSCKTESQIYGISHNNELPRTGGLTRCMLYSNSYQQGMVSRIAGFAEQSQVSEPISIGLLQLSQRPCDCCVGQFWPNETGRCTFREHYSSIFILQPLWRNRPANLL